MQLKELIELPLFKNSKTLTGTIGLTNPVASVMVLEAIDIEKWSKKDQLILTSFYAFTDLSMDQLRVFFEKMQQIGVSGLVVKVDRLIPMIPEWIIGLSFDYQIPLIKVQQDVSYEAIMLAVYEPLLNHQTHLLRTYYEVRQRFMKVERNHSSFEQIMQEFYQLIEKPCSLRIPHLDVQVAIGQSFKNYVVTKSEPMKTIEFTKNYYEYLELFSHENNQYVTAIKVDIINPFNDLCTLIVYQKDSQIPEAKVMIIENVVDVIYERLQMEYLLKKERYNRMNNLAEAILQSTPNNSEELAALLQEAQLDRYDYYQGIAFASNTFKDKQRKIAVLHKLRALKTAHVFFEHHNYLVVLYNFQQLAQEISKKNLEKQFEVSLLSEESACLAVSEVFTKEHIKEILPQCLDAIRFNRQFYLGPILTYSDLGIFSSFIKENQLERLQQSIPPKLYQMSEEDEELFTTFYTFFISNRNYKKTAEALFLHSKTIRYRLNKIEQLLEIDLTNPIQLVNYEIGTYLLELKKRSRL
ncbi:MULTISPECIES: PucR family transcriptional regulator [Enterococcus]|uniref:PucR family transcriptional regulator n=1 Tax=Enterococcus TaxID=1350 RepID=UPI001330AC3D|nr:MULTISPECIES: PucR family transcriptional regulator [Enterococcus]MDO6296840.1 PucR family transcriptional regulator [Enterococcus gallinarum]